MFALFDMFKAILTRLGLGNITTEDTEPDFFKETDSRFEALQDALESEERRDS